jgi:hypothetical protein
VFNESGEASQFDGAETKTFTLQIQEFWTSISIGGFAHASNRFYEAEIGLVPQVLKVSCPVGKFNLDPDTTYYGLIPKEENAIYTMYQADYSCNVQEAFLLAFDQCIGKQTCDLIFSPTWFKSECYGKEDYKLYLKLYCTDTSILVNGKRQLTKQYLSVVVFIVSMSTLLIFLVYLVNQKYAERKTIKYFNEEKALPSDYSLQIKGLPKGLNE